jgi:predicted nucleotide-binding protein (sugar kinase/HSP70/actin superfamily)
VGKYARTVAARSVLCYWESRELGIRTVGLVRKLQRAHSTWIFTQYIRQLHVTIVMKDKSNAAISVRAS